MILQLFSTASFVLIFLVYSAGKSLAGGGPVAFRFEPYGPLNPGEQYIVHVQVYADGPYPTYCKNCRIELKLKNPQDSDYIAQSSDKTDNDGRIYAKVISKTSGNREIYADFWRIDGTFYPNNSSAILRYTGPSVDYPVSNGITTPQYNPAENVKTEPVRLPAIRTKDPSVDQPEKVDKEDQAIVPDKNDSNNSKVEDLNKKVTQLQNQLEESKKQQGVLEKRITDLVNFIKKLFPFFK